MQEHVSGSIASSLNDAVHETIADSALPFGDRDRLIWNVAEDVYGWVIDFTRDLRPGDHFDFLYERLVSSEGEVRYGRLLAASIETAGKPNTAYVMSDGQNRNVYYDGEGRSMRRAFLRYPVQFRRISGGYGRRYHPILRRYREHLGTDYAAVSGTPIYATADGVVRRAGRWGGYGLVVTVEHAKDIETRYGHMSRVASGIRPGTRVTQGQTIGFVGMTGLATGPHVHYEFLKNDRQVDSRSVDMGDGDPGSSGVAEGIRGRPPRLSTISCSTAPRSTAPSWRRDSSRRRCVRGVSWPRSQRCWRWHVSHGIHGNHGPPHPSRNWVFPHPSKAIRNRLRKMGMGGVHQQVTLRCSECEKAHNPMIAVGIATVIAAALAGVVYLGREGLGVEGVGLAAAAYRGVGSIVLRPLQSWAIESNLRSCANRAGRRVVEHGNGRESLASGD